VRKYLLRRLLNMVPTLVLVTLIVFSLLRLLPSDPVRILAGVDESGAIDPVLYVKIKTELGLDRPLIEQYGRWMVGVVRGDWGKSYLTGMRVFPQIVDRLKFTVQLAIVSWIFGLVLGISLGTISAIKRNSPADIAATAFAISGVAIPHFWLGMMLIILFAVWLGWLPFGGFNASLFTSPGLWLKHMLLPTFVLGFAQSPLQPVLAGGRPPRPGPVESADLWRAHLPGDRHRGGEHGRGAGGAHRRDRGLVRADLG
jgi:peptide/nickel transport system permease protein